MKKAMDCNCCKCGKTAFIFMARGGYGGFKPYCLDCISDKSKDNEKVD